MSDDFASMIDASFKSISVGQTLTGTVISVDENGALLDLASYAPGIIKADQFSDDPHFKILAEVHVGDEITASVISTDDGRGNVILSKLEESHTRGWEQFKKWKADKTTVSVKITETTKGGAIAYLEGIRAFIPASKLALSFVENLDEYVGKTVEAIVITADEDDEKLVLSCRELLQESAKAERDSRAQRLQPGMIMEGTVESLMDYGAFVNIGDGLSGLVHISQIPYPKRLVHPKYALKVGQQVRVKVTKVENGKVSLTMKELDAVTDKDIDEDVNVEYVDNAPADDSMAQMLKKLGLLK